MRMPGCDAWMRWGMGLDFKKYYKELNVDPQESAVEGGGGK